MLRLPPTIHPEIRELLSEQERIFEWAHALGSPLNMVFPGHVVKNVTAFEEILRHHGVKYELRCAHKPVQSRALVRAIAHARVGMDVASLGELHHALGCGFRGEQLVATGPKNHAFISLALLHRVVVSVDSWDELRTIAHLAAVQSVPAQVLVRLHGFAATYTAIHSKDTRFGIHVCEVAELISFFLQTPTVQLVGFAFHLNAATQQEKIIAIEQTIGALRDALVAGLQPRVLNIGGGFHITMVENRDAWDAYETALRQSVLDGGPTLSWDKSGLGYRVAQGVITGAPQFHDHAPMRVGAQELGALLTAPLPAFQDQTVAAVLRDMLLELWIEPGQATYDQAGITIASVLSVKKSAQGEFVVVLDMNRSNLNTIDLQHMADPVVLHRGESSGEGVGVFFAGNLCLAADMITRHKVFLPQMPNVGDLVVFTNTAPYRMQFAQSQTLLQRTAQTIAVTRRTGTWTWCMDDLYQP